MNDTPGEQTGQPLPTPLATLHGELGAKMVPFAGYSMPVSYPAGILAEHRHCRAKAALFDVSHMGQVRITGDDPQAAARALERLVPVDVLGLAKGRQRYALLANDEGGIRDDLMVTSLGSHLFLVVNAANKAADLAHLVAGLPDCSVEMLEDRALLALQGPAAGAVLAGLAPALADTRFMDVVETELAGVPAIISRSGYTGEDGFEISVPAAEAEALARRLLSHDDVEPAGLGARDALRLEAGLCLHGQDIDATTSPVEAGLTWAIQKVRRSGGAREGGFPGAKRILRELAEGPSRLRTGLLPQGRAPVRAGVPLFETEVAGEPVGQVTSGGFGPSLEAPVSMGYLPPALSIPGTTVFAELRGRRIPCLTAAMPFVPSRFKKS